MNNKRSHFRRIWIEIRWIVIGIMWFLSLSLGAAGFSKYAIENNLNYPISECIYRSIQLISMNSGAVDGINNWMLEIARFLLPALTAYTLFQAITQLFREQMQWFQLWWVRDHIIICGLGRKGSYLVDDLLSQNKRILAIETNIDPITANDYRRNGVLTFEGDASDIDTLESARITRASHLICFLGEDQQNLKIAQKAYRVARNNGTHPLKCIVHLASKDLLNLVKRSELNLKLDDPFILEIFNIYEQASNQLIQYDSAWYTNAKKPPTVLLIIGLGRLGLNLCTQAAYKWYRKGYTRKLEIVIIDREANKKIDQLTAENPKLEAVCRFTPIQADLRNNQNIKKTLSAHNRHIKIDRVYVCLGNPLLSLQITLILQQIPELNQIPIYVRMEKNSGLVEILNNPISGLENQNNTIPFDIYEQTCSAELVLGGIHELLALKLRQNYLENLGTPEAARLLDTPWEEVPEKEKESNRQQVKRIRQLLNNNGYRIETLTNWEAGDFIFTKEEIEKMAVMEHNLWCQWKRENDWRYGKERNDQMKTNPDLVLWDDLPEDERLKNKDFIRNLPGLLAEFGFQINH